jgi:uncharacterized protein
MPQIIILIVLLLTAGCATKPGDSSKQDPGLVSSVQGRSANVQSLLVRADRSDQETASLSRVEAAAISVNQGEFEQAKNILSLVTTPFVSADSTRQFLTTSARIALYEGDPSAALDALNNNRLQTIPLTQDLQIGIGRLRSEAYRQNRSYVASARERIYFDSLLNADEKTRNHEYIFSVLLELPASSLTKHASNAITSDLRGWLSLAAMTKQYNNDPLKQLRELNNWKMLWSHHPAATQLPASLQMLSRVVREQPSNIALLLPLQGDLAPFGRAIRDGILAAHYEQQNSTTIRIYDTSKLAIGTMIVKAVEEGAELIIGPLDRENVDSLVEMDLAVPVIALNRTTEERGNPDLYQFGLAPEDEMIQVADQVVKEGYAKALLIAPEGEWGERNLGVFRDRWESLGGITVNEAIYSSQRDYSDMVKSLLSVDSSQQRSLELRRIIGQKFEFTPRRRQDVDFIFLLANPAQARGINPTLAFFYADDIPVYATSHIHEYSGSRIDAIDLNGIRFCDIPWKLTDTDKLQKEIFSLWDSSQTTFAPFFALGVDAYRLYPRLQQLKEISGERLFGATGILQLENNTIVRNLMWAQFKNGNVISIPMVF